MSAKIGTYRKEDIKMCLKKIYSTKVVVEIPNLTAKEIAKYRKSFVGGYSDEPPTKRIKQQNVSKEKIPETLIREEKIDKFTSQLKIVSNERDNSSRNCSSFVAEITENQHSNELLSNSVVNDIKISMLKVKKDEFFYENNYMFKRYRMLFHGEESERI